MSWRDRPSSSSYRPAYGDRYNDRSSGPPCKLLYIDGANFMDNLTDWKEPDSTWDIRVTQRRIARFVGAASRAGVRLKVFINDATPSDESNNVWRERREVEVLEGSKDVPQGATILLGDLFKSCKVEVAYNLEADLSDTIATHAQHDDAAILSRNKRMFSYIGRKYRVYGKYGIGNDGRLWLQEWKPPSPEKAAPPRDLLPNPPECLPAIILTGSKYVRGVPSPLMRALDTSPHAIVSPLRRAMYFRTGEKGPVTELWPEWDEETQGVKWHEEDEVYPSEEELFLELLEKPNEAVEHLFPKEASNAPAPPGIEQRMWERHMVCVRSLVYEMCARSSKGKTSLLDMWKEHEEEMMVRQMSSMGIRAA